jgi:hypothetical protein
MASFARNIFQRYAAAEAARRATSQRMALSLVKPLVTRFRPVTKPPTTTPGVAPVTPTTPVLIASGGAGAPAGATTIATPAVEEVAQEMESPVVPEQAGIGGSKVIMALVILGALLAFGKAGRGRRNW